MKHAVGYVRVSREKQGRFGLGLEAQQAALQRFAAAEGFAITEVFVEVESGKHDADRRPVLAKALVAGEARSRSDPGRQARPAEPRRALHQRPDEAQRAVHRRRVRRRHRPVYAAHLRRSGQERAAPDWRAHQGRALQAAKARGVSLGGRREQAFRAIWLATPKPRRSFHSPPSVGHWSPPTSAFAIPPRDLDTQSPSAWKHPLPQGPDEARRMGSRPLFPSSSRI